MRLPLFAALILGPAAALAQQPAAEQQPAADQQASTGQPPQRIRNVTLQRGETCPKATGDEVVVCSTIVEPYRIPKTLRRTEPSAANQSWVNRTAYADGVGRRAAGLPDTCSPVGTGGQTGCSITWNQAYAADKRAKKREAESTPGGEE